MVTVHREGAFRFAVYRNDHEPAHIHVLGDGEVIVNLKGEGGLPEIRQSVGTTRADRRKVLAIVTERQAWLLARWQEIQDEAD